MKTALTFDEPRWEPEMGEMVWCIVRHPFERNVFRGEMVGRHGEMFLVKGTDDDPICLLYQDILPVAPDLAKHFGPPRYNWSVQEPLFPGDIMGGPIAGTRYVVTEAIVDQDRNIQYLIEAVK